MQAKLNVTTPKLKFDQKIKCLIELVDVDLEGFDSAYFYIYIDGENRHFLCLQVQNNYKTDFSKPITLGGFNFEAQHRYLTL